MNLEKIDLEFTKKSAKILDIRYCCLIRMVGLLRKTSLRIFTLSSPCVQYATRSRSKSKVQYIRWIRFTHTLVTKLS